MVTEYKEIEQLKNNMNDYLGRDKTEKEKESIIGVIKRQKIENENKKSEHNKHVIEDIEI